MIIVLRDPSGISGAERYSTRNATWREHLFDIFPDGLDEQDWRIVFNGQEIEPYELDLDDEPCFSDVLIMQHRPRGLDGVFKNLFPIASFIGDLLSPSANLNDMGAGKDSPNNQFHGQTNLPRPYQAWPDIFGRIRAYPDIIVPAVQQYVDNIKQLEHIFWIGRGSFDITNVRYADTDIASYSGSSYTVYGDGVAIPTVTEQFASPEVNGQELLGTNETTLSGISSTALPFSGTYVRSGSIGVLTVRVLQSTATDNLKTDFDAGATTCAFSVKTTAGRTYNLTGTIQSFTFVDLNPDFYYDIVINTIPPVDDSETVDTAQNFYIETYTAIQIGPFILPVTLTQIWYNIIFLRGLKGTASFTAEWWAIDLNDDEIGGSRQSESFSYSDDTSDQKYFTRKVTPAYGQGRYKFQITRTNEADIDNGTNQAKLEAVFAMRFLSNVIYQINGVGGTAIKINSSATEQATSGSELKFNCFAQRKVITANANGTINSTPTASRRIVDSVVHHMHIDGGVPLAQIDVAGLYAIQQSITPAGNGYFDGSFDDVDVSLGERIKAMCNAGRILVSREGTQWTFVREEAKPFPVATFDRRTTGRDDYTLTISPSQQKAYDSIELEWYDIAETNKKRTLRVKWNSTTGLPELGYGSRPQKIQLTGCSSYEQALDRAEMEMRRIVYQRKQVRDIALADANFVWRGDRVRWVDVADVHSSNGEILAVSGTTYTTSEECVFETGVVYKVCITDADGYSSSFVTATARHDGKNGFVAAGLPTPILANGTTIRLGSRYVLVKESAVSSNDYILASKTPNEDGTVQIELVQYDSRIYDRVLS